MGLVGSGAIVLVVLSAVFTVYLVNRPSTPSRVAVVTPSPVVKSSPATSSIPIANEPASPAIVVPKIAVPSQTPSSAEPSIAPSAATTAAPSTSTVVSPPAVQTHPAAISPGVTQPSTPTSVPTTPAATQASPVAQTTPAPAPSLAPDTPDERITAFVDSVRVTGIRSSGAESRVLMNERVYRVNDIVERTMNVRLISAAADSLTFSDSRGVTYVKRF